MLETLSNELSNDFEVKESKEKHVNDLDHIFLEIIIFLAQLVRVFVQP